MRFTLFFAIGALVLSGLARAEAPIPPVSPCTQYIGECAYYVCEEGQRGCGLDGYLIRFGYHYCSIFQDEVKDRFSSRGEAWLSRVASCLQAKIDSLPASLSCGQLEDAAIDSHSECYLETGFCELGLMDQIRIFKVVHSELKDPRMTQVFRRIEAGCQRSFSLP